MVEQKLLHVKSALEEEKAVRDSYIAYAWQSSDKSAMMAIIMNATYDLVPTPSRQSFS